MTDRYKDYGRVCTAMCRAIEAAKTWADIVECANALQHVHLRFRLLDAECARHEQEGGFRAAPSEDAARALSEEAS